MTMNEGELSKDALLRHVKDWFLFKDSRVMGMTIEEKQTIAQLKRIVNAHFQPDKVGDIEERVEKLMFEWDRGNFTVCPNCKVDDFVHVEGCKFEDDNIITRLAKLLSRARPIPSSPIKVTREWVEEEYGYLLDQIQEEYFRLHGSVGMEKFMFILNDKLWTFLIEELGVEVEK